MDIKVLTKESDVLLLLNNPALKEHTTGVKGYDQHIPMDPHKLYVGGRRDGELVGMIPISVLTNRTAEVHISVLPKFWGTSLPLRFGRKVKNFLKQYGKFDVLYSYTPANSRGGIDFLERMGFESIGRIPKGVEYFGEEADLVMYILDLRSN